MFGAKKGHKHPYDAGLFQGFVLGAIIGVYIWEMNKSLEDDSSA